MHIAHAIMLFSSLEAVKAGKEKAIQIRGGEKGGFLFYCVCAYCILPIMVARKGYLSGFSLLAFFPLYYTPQAVFFS